MTPQTFIFIGRSGCGKGTQAELLIEKLKVASPEHSVFHLETGALFRDFVKESGYSNELAKSIMERGERQPDFLAVWMWSHLLVKNLVVNQHVLIDGTPRSLAEALTLDTAMSFYGRKLPKVVYLNISPDTSVNRLTSRDRADDRSIANIAKKLAWFETHVMPAVEYYRTNSNYQFIEVDGEKTVEEIHQAISQAVGL